MRIKSRNRSCKLNDLWAMWPRKSSSAFRKSFVFNARYFLPLIRVCHDVVSTQFQHLFHLGAVFFIIPTRIRVGVISSFLAMAVCFSLLG